MVWSLTAATLSEVPFWFLSAGLLRRFRHKPDDRLCPGNSHRAQSGDGGAGQPVVVLPINLLHGPSFAVLWAAGVADADAAAPPGLAPPAQGLFSA